MKSLIVSAGALVLSALLASCGGGGGGDGDNAAAAQAAAGAWLTFSPSSIDFTLLPNTEKSFNIVATASKPFPAGNVGIFDSKGVITPNFILTANSSRQYSVSLTTNRLLAAGTYTGSFEVRLCYDTDPRVCSRPVEGSPWQVPYTIKILAATDLSFSNWEGVGTADPGFVDNFALSYRSGKPVVVTGDVRTGRMETWTSSDSGASWAASTSNPTPLVTGFALASDGDTIYLSSGLELIGGQRSTQYRSDVWAFDGTTWQLKTTSAAFPGREEHVMAKVGGTLFVAGGRNASGPLSDIWKSTDSGVNWTRVAASLPAAFGTVSCALNWKNSLLIVGDQVGTSTDGVNWSAQTVYPSYFPQNSTQCAAVGGKLFVGQTGLGTFNKNTVSSTDLIHWQPEPTRYAGPDDAPGMAVVDGRLMVTDRRTMGLKVYRTVP